MSLAFVLHLYQPWFQKDTVVKAIYETCYDPLLSLIEAHKDLKLTLNVPVSFIEVMSKCGYTDWLVRLKKLVLEEQIELTGSAAYHPLLTMLPEVEYIEDQILLNEYLLSIIFGETDLEDGINLTTTLKNVRGFFSPELALNSTVLGVLSDLGFDWVLGDENHLAKPLNGIEPPTLVKVTGNTCHIVVRNKHISNAIAFCRTGELSDYAFMTKPNTVVIGLDAETFGHHNPSGIDLLSTVYHQARKYKASFSKISELNHTRILEVTSLNDATWFGDTLNTTYDMWNNKNNIIHFNTWEVLTMLLNEYKRTYLSNKTLFSPLAYYKTLINFKKLCNMDLGQLIHENSAKVNLMLKVMKQCNSDQFWWASGVKVFDKVIIDTEVVNYNINYTNKIVSELKNSNTA